MAASLAASPALAEQIGPIIPAEPGKFRVDIAGGAFIPQFARFQYGDVRAAFPLTGSPVLAEAWNDRPHAAGHYAGGAIAYGLPSPLFGAPTEIIGGFNYGRAEDTSFLSDDSAGPNIFVPYIDAQVRTTLAGGSVVILNSENDFSLERTLRVYSAHAGIRQHYMVDGFTVSPAAIFIFRRVEQRDFLSGTTNGDVGAHTLSAKVNSNHFQIGGALGVSRPVISYIVWFANLSGGADIVHANYSGQQTFGPNATFNLPFEQFASASDSRTRVGFFAGVQSGFTYVLFPGAAVTIAGNFRYTSAVPYVIYPTPITGTLNSSGPARIGFQGQFVYGGAVNLSIKLY